jgi:hypothetical protein
MKKSKTKKLNDIGHFELNCYKCNSIKTYINKRSYQHALKTNPMCYKCAGKSMAHIASAANKGRKLSDDAKKRIGNKNRGKFPSEETRRKISEACSGEKNGFYGKKHTDETRKIMSEKWNYDKHVTPQMIEKQKSRPKRKYTKKERLKMRENALRRIKKHGWNGNINPIACKFMDKIGKKLGFKFQHGLNGGEITKSGYRLDGYDEKNNVVFEYDEPHHERRGKKIKDLIRQKNIINEINCKFIRYSEKYNVLYETTATYSKIITF